MREVRVGRPLIHHITNFVVMNETANITLAAGALPVMAHAREEVEEMVTGASAVVLNIGTLWPEQIEAMKAAGRRANELGIPVVFDPVGVGATRYRTDSALSLLSDVCMTTIRANAAEMAVLAGYDAEIKGVEAIGGASVAREVAAAIAEKYDCTAAITGPVDIVADRQRIFSVNNGHVMMAQVTGTGCMATSIVAAYTALENDHALAAASALAAYGLAGQNAAGVANGPGTFHVLLYDALANLTEDALRTGGEITSND